MRDITTTIKNLTNINLIQHKHAIEIIHKQREKYIHTAALHTKPQQYTSLQDLKENLCNGRFNIDINNAHYECLFHHKTGDNLYVIFDGARLTSRMPNFPRWTYHNMFDGSYLGIEDPMYFKYQNLKLGWYYGTKSHSYIEDSLLIIKTICDAIDISYENIIFFSSSGGGYASIYAASLVDNSLSISLNPQIILQNYHSIKNFSDITGINLDEKDTLNRNNLIMRIKDNRTSKHIILCNVQDTHQFEQHIVPLASALSIPIKYGLSSNDNVLLWIYDNDGAPSPHTAFETKAIYSVIDYIAKEFKKNTINTYSQNLVVSINEIWHEIYIDKNKLYESSTTNNFILLEDQLVMDKDISTCDQYDIRINKNSKKYNHFKINLAKNTRNSIIIPASSIKSSSKTISIVLFDFIQNKTIYRTDKSIQKDIVLNIIITNENNYGICIYAGLQGATQEQHLSITNLEHRYQSLS